MVSGRRQLLDIALSHVNKSLPFVRFVDCVLKRQFDRPKALDSLLYRALMQACTWSTDDEKWEPAMVAMKRAIDWDLCPQSGDDWDRWAKLTFAQFERTREESGLLLSLKACLTGMDVGNSVSFALQIVSMLGKYACESLCRVFVAGCQSLPSGVWIALLPQITAMLRNPLLRTVLERLLLLIAVENANVVVYGIMPAFMSGSQSDATAQLQSLYPSIVDKSLLFSRKVV
jgi:hypothetical protein